MLTETKPGLLEVIDWQRVHAVPNDASFAPTVLLDFELPYEYPRTVEDLLLHLDVKGLSSSRVLAHLMLASERVAQGVPLYVGIGTPSRGIAGDLAQRRQHLTFWEIEAGDVVILRNASLACGISSHYGDRETPEEIQTLIDAVWETLVAWRKSARVRWCQVMENRPEILTRRDEGTPMDWFRGKRVALWGCGAIGGQIAEHLARAGVAELTLYDRARVNPGILVRQNFAKSDVNESKAQALAQRIQSIAPAVTVNAKIENVFSRTLSTTDWDADVDVVIDATASLRVRSKLEARIKDHEPRIPVAGVMLSASAEHAIAVLAPAAYRAGTLDVFRRLGLAAFNRGWLSDWAKAFWTDDAVQGLRQPEPGCSDPTFVASHADVSALSARAMNVIATSLAEGGETASGFLMSQSSDQREHRFRFRPHIRWVAAGLDFRMSAAAWRDMDRMDSRPERANGRRSTRLGAYCSAHSTRRLASRGSPMSAVRRRTARSPPSTSSAEPRARKNCARTTKTVPMASSDTLEPGTPIPSASPSRVRPTTQASVPSSPQRLKTARIN